MGIEKITKSNLAQHFGSACFYRHSLLRSCVMSEGAYFLCENGAAWLIDVIVSYQHTPTVKACDKQMWLLTVDKDNSSGKVECFDYNGDYEDLKNRVKPLVSQVIPYTDFPLAEIEIMCANNGSGRTIYLPTED